MVIKDFVLHKTDRPPPTSFKKDTGNSILRQMTVYAHSPFDFYKSPEKKKNLKDQHFFYQMYVNIYKL